MSTITILHAVYGSITGGSDVTAICQELVNNGNDDIPVNNTTFNDPTPETPKSFGILYSNPLLNQGNPIALACNENQTLDLVPFPPTATTVLQQQLKPAANIEVISAVYGTPINGNDVTAICQALINQRNYTIPVNNATLGPDPDPNVLKSFSILYSVNGNTFALACQENTNLLLPIS